MRSNLSSEVEEKSLHIARIEGILKDSREDNQRLSEIKASNESTILGLNSEKSSLKDELASKAVLIRELNESLSASQSECAEHVRTIGSREERIRSLDDACQDFEANLVKKVASIMDL